MGSSSACSVEFLEWRRRQATQLAVSRTRFDVAALGDETLVELARRGDEDAIRILIMRHNQRLFRVARGVVCDDAEAEDIVQETYVRAFTRLDSFRGETQLSTWLTRIALNDALGRMRRRRPLAELAELDAGTVYRDVQTRIVFHAVFLPLRLEATASLCHQSGRCTA